MRQEKKNQWRSIWCTKVEKMKHFLRKLFKIHWAIVTWKGNTKNPRIKLLEISVQSVSYHFVGPEVEWGVKLGFGRWKRMNIVSWNILCKFYANQTKCRLKGSNLWKFYWVSYFTNILQMTWSGCEANFECDFFICPNLNFQDEKIFSLQKTEILKFSSTNL